MTRLTEAQQQARIGILREVAGFGGAARWSQLHSRGHHFKQVEACASRGDLEEVMAYSWRITDAGRAVLNNSQG